MSSIQATEQDTTKFLSKLEQISAQQIIICRQLDELLHLMQMPSESVMEVVEKLSTPMGLEMQTLAIQMTHKLKEA
ncbi:hypothetical protein GCM10009425_40620 [Pseudomonas asuensis]|uniref:Uncharacterized protein n=1 Tax=Pseudomonas asuensis TaxID=1825787 RepID=A0ABQ2H1D6_9PSED|nr:hypothetical protein GCM10009425_40620 [Pseudomonas asuensis]